MDLREALKWCSNNIGKKLRVNGIRCLAPPIAIRIREDGVIEGEGTSGVWERVIGWWIFLTNPEVTFSIPEEEESSEEEALFKKFGCHADAVKEFVRFYGLKKGE